MYYILDGHTPIKAEDMLKWAMWFETADRIVAQTEISEAVMVSTVFLGLDHNYTGEGPPVLFETFVFGGELEGECHRYRTWEEAEEGHERIVKIVRWESEDQQG